MSYLSYAEYTEMGGTLTETEFGDLNFEAECYVDWYTFNRLHNEETIPDRVKICIYYIIRLLQKQMELMNSSLGNPESSDTTSVAGIAHQSNDGVSISYNVISAHDALDLIKKEIDNMIRRYLQGITNSLGRKLLYRGIYPDE